MNKELLMLYGLGYAVQNMIDHDSWGYGKIIAGKLESVDWSDICDYLAYLIDKCKENGGI